jgi:hypothetical protein
MILVIIRMKVLSDKRMELSQTITSLSGSIRMEKGCQRCDFAGQIRIDEIRGGALRGFHDRRGKTVPVRA